MKPKYFILIFILVLFLVVVLLLRATDDSEIFTSNQNNIEFYKSTINRIFEDLEIKKKNISVYFYDLDKDESFFINKKEEFYAASITKIPVMMAYYKYAETNPSILYEQVELKEIFPDEYNVKYPPHYKMRVGERYLMSDLIYRMIKDSDNVARRLLINYVLENYTKDTSMSIDSYSDIFDALGIKNPDHNPEAIMNPKEVSLFFKSLYKKNYLNDEFSEIALSVLKESTFRMGLRKYLPPEIKVASKFGEFYDHKNELRYLHDCGIIYHPRKHYILCVMTKGKDDMDLSSRIAHISQELFKLF